MQRLLLAAVSLLVVACGGPTGSQLVVPDAPGARSWGSGAYGLVLVPDDGRDAASWGRAARAFADDGMTVLAVGSPDDDGVVAALRYLLEQRGLERVALLGAGAGAGAALRVVAAEPGLVDQLIVLSATGDVSGLGELPKLFVASAGEARARDAERMAAEAAGAWNELYLAEGDASGQEILDGAGADGAMAAILRRLNERR